MLAGKTIVLAITGGIAAYKAAEITRLLVKEGAIVRVLMTKNAQEFITPLTLQTLSGNPVATETFSLTQESEIGHIRLADTADLILIAPASADVIGKVAHGIADDLLTTVLLATTAPVLVAPAMNVHMYAHPAVQENMRILAVRGYRFVEPGEGFLACGYEGKGRLADPEDIIEDTCAALTKKDLTQDKIIVTAGPNAEPIDPVRFITNRSTGKMGFAMARVAWHRGAEVTLVSGPTSLLPPRGVRFCPVRTAREMQRTILEHYPQATIVVSAAAVADYRPVHVASQKIKKKEGNFAIELTRNPDILGELSQQKGHRLHVGFATETEHVLENAARKLRNKNLDMIVANDVTQEGAGFAHDTNIVTLIDRSERMESLPIMSKDEVAHVVYDRLLSLREGKGETEKRGNG